MTSKQRLLIALNRQEPDRLPVTMPHLAPYFLKKYMSGISYEDFFDLYNLDAIHWTSPHKPDISIGDRVNPEQGGHWISSDNWKISFEDEKAEPLTKRRFQIVTPGGKLTTVLQFDERSTRIVEPLIKEKRDIELIGKYAPIPLCDTTAVNKEAAELGERGIIRGQVCSFGINGQSGIWQDAVYMTGNDRLIMLAHEDPNWVHELLRILQHRKALYIKSLKGADYDLVEYGGDAANTIITPRIFDKFVADYDSELIRLAHGAGQKVVYHTCNGMMPILEMIADTKPDAIETFSAKDMGEDIDLAEVKLRIGKRTCLIGGFDQKRYLSGCRPEETRREVRRCFEAAGAMGGFILAPSEPFLDADPVLIEAFSDEARKCIYD